MTDSTPVRLLPLTEHAPNEGVANLLARLLIEDQTQINEGVQASLLILTGLQTFLDTGDYQAVELVWEPVIVTRQFLKAYDRDNARQKATEMAKSCRAVHDDRMARIYERAVELLTPQNSKNNC